ncbi:MAG: hypothetical protein PHV17_00880, partial [Candidatus Omnitrophica bacterium]|nr:hypothetical protein [Candidatus Omnitrophota bacterium]
LDQIETKQKRYHEKLQEKEQAFKETERLREEFQILEADAEAVLSEINYLEAKQKELETKLAFFEETLSATQESLRLNQERVASNSQEITIIDIETAKRQEQLQSLDKEKESLISKIQILEDERTNLLRNLEDNSQENKDNAGKIEYFQEEIEKVSAKMEEGKAKVQSFLENKTALEKDQGDLMLERQTKSKQIKEVEKESEEIKTSIYNQKLEVQSLEYEKGKVKDYLNQVYSITFEPVEKETIDCSLDVFFQNRDRLQKKKKSLGEVNLVAIEEFEELKQRDDFLNKQKEDLIASKDNLRKAILRINRTSREIFMEVFTKIVEEFKKNFRFLFNGGRAQLVLVDPDNVLDSGVEIEVQPPGKKLQNVSLLSGGEKALTAIALIFAIFQVRPSPLCVLDEIDAPLDEANVDRFNHMLKEFSAFSQFLLITHNKKTMGNANVLYGVTMQEKGVSKLVSVKFNEEEQKAKPSALTNQEVTT